MFNFKKIALLCGVIVIADVQAVSNPMPAIRRSCSAMGQGALAAGRGTLEFVKHPVVTAVAAKDACVNNPQATVGVILCAAGVIAAIKFRKKIRNGFKKAREFVFGKKSAAEDVAE